VRSGFPKRSCSNNNLKRDLIALQAGLASTGRAEATMVGASFADQP
jgi:hypothetical protein